MLGTWVLSLGVICLLQCLVSGEPRPDFALDANLFGTVRVTGALNDTQLLVTGINANLEITLNSTYPGLMNLLELTQEVGETITELLENVLNPLTSLAPSSSSEDVELFSTVLNAVESVQTFLDNRLNEINSEVGAIVFSVSLPSQFSDALNRVGSGLQELASALEALQTAVTAILNENSEESDSCPPKPIRPKLVYRVVYAVRTLRAYLPAVTYTLTTTVENIAIVDKFVVDLNKESENVQEPSQYVNLVLATTNTVSTAVNSAVSTVVTRYNTVNSEVMQLQNLTSLMAYGGVEAMLSSFNTTLQQLSSVGPAFNASLADIAEQLRLALLPNVSTPTVNNGEVVATLVRTLLASGRYARFCFYKYAELVFGLANEALLGAETCINKEMMRLLQLRTALLAQIPLLLFDLEDITAELTVCNSINNVASRESCVSLVAGYYNAVASSFQIKFDNLYATGIAEAVASKNRLLACVGVIQFNIVDGSAQSLKSMIEQCAQNGP